MSDVFPIMNRSNRVDVNKRSCAYIFGYEVSRPGNRHGAGVKECAAVQDK